MVMSNISMHDNTFDTSAISINTFVNFSCIDVTMSGVNYFAWNYGGSVINVVSSNLTVTGNLTVNDGSAYHDGGIRLDSASTLFLKELLFSTILPLKVMQYTHQTMRRGGREYRSCQVKFILLTMSPK